jgi:uncharacterized RDD family membrane protein YckC
MHANKMPSTDHIHFETPENIQVSYRAAGLGTRFLAWLLDNILLTIVMIVIFFILMLLGVFSDVLLRHLPKPGNPEKPGEVLGGMAYALGLFLLISGLGGFVYYIACELLLGGQTLGKRQMGLRVVTASRWIR